MPALAGTTLAHAGDRPRRTRMARMLRAGPQE